jgi:3-hydroxy acid dehydrogenase / malonic semialdehyde reductase
MAPPRVLVTGATSGIGLATAQLFGRKGWRVLLHGRDAKKLRTAASQIGDGAQTVRFDVRDASAVAKALRGVGDDLDVLVNNAGLARGLEPLQEGEPEGWDETLDVNVKGLLYVTRAILPGMVKRGRGHVVNLGSTAGHWVYRGGAVYCASKHAVRALTEALRLDVHGTGVRVSTVDPGIVAGTEFSLVRFGGDRERARKVYEGFQPLTPQDIAETIAWVVDRPAHVNIQEVILTPTDQASVRDVHRKTS